MNLQIDNLRVNIAHGGLETHIIRDISLKIDGGEKVLIVGPSGSGKSTLLDSIGRINHWNTSYTYSGNITFKGCNLMKLSHREMSELLGKKIAYIFQEPQACFNPLMRVGEQIAETFELKKNQKSSVADVIQQWFGKVNLNDPNEIYYSYPHQLSGGQLQRVAMVMALIHGPELVLADEPTSALDIENQQWLFDILDDLRISHQTSVVMVSHDARLIHSWADSYYLMEDGIISASGKPHELQINPKSTFIQSLLTFDDRCKQLEQKRAEKHPVFVDTAIDIPVLKVVGLQKFYKNVQGKDGVKKIFEDIEFELFRGRSIGVSGGSGSGKSTLARCLVKLENTESGQIFWEQEMVSLLTFEEILPLRKNVQMVFQDIRLSLPPHMNVADILDEAISIAGNKEYTSKMLLHSVGMSDIFGKRFTHELSGGQRQRICIARAMAFDPKVLILDEVLSMLDIVTQSQIVELLLEKQAETGVSYVFISHDRQWMDVFTDHILYI
ncbi:MAG: ABC transporter ATP-binding protein [Saprospiraceae bacterium]|nr:ABC transporter ATP-binding protein [Saprospiraceae bacterium]